MVAGYKESEILLLTLPSCIMIINAYKKHISNFEEILKKHAMFTSHAGGKEVSKKWKTLRDLEEERNNLPTKEELDALYKIKDDFKLAKWINK